MLRVIHTNQDVYFPSEALLFSYGLLFPISYFMNFMNACSRKHLGRLS